MLFATAKMTTRRKLTARVTARARLSLFHQLQIATTIPNRGLIMKDAGIEAKRDRPAATKALVAQLGQYEAVVQAALVEAERASVIQRIWDKDASLWKTDPAHQKIIANSLGWLTVPRQMIGATDELEVFAEQNRDRKDFNTRWSVAWAARRFVLKSCDRLFAGNQRFPELLVLDSTDPDAINNLAKQIELSSCLFIIASKSGTTTEPMAFHRYWYHEVGERVDGARQAFHCHHRSGHTNGRDRCRRKLQTHLSKSSQTLAVVIQPFLTLEWCPPR